MELGRGGSAERCWVSGEIVEGEGAEGVELAGLPLGGGLEFGGHELGDAGSGFEGGAGVQQEGAGTAGEDIVEGACHFVANGPEDLAFEDGELGVNGCGAEGENLRGLGAVDGEMSELGGVGVPAMDFEIASGARALVEHGDGGGLVDAILGHVAVGGPFAAGDRDEAGGIDVEGVVAGEGGGGGGAGGDEGPDAGKGAEDIGA
jgi:hypothetical protein